MSKISNELDRLAVLRAEVAEVESRIGKLIPQDLLDELAAAKDEASSCEAGIKKIAENLRSDHKRTFRGKTLQIVYSDTTSYPKAAVKKNVPPRYLKLCEKVSHSWRIVKAAQ